MNRLKIYLLPLLTLLLVTCSDNSTNSDTEDLETNPNAELDCERLGYPCSLADVPEAVYEASYNALLEAQEIMNTGTMEDVRSYLEELPDMAEVNGDETAIRFRFEGGSPAWFLDVNYTSIALDARKPSQSFRDDVMISNSVVGEDRTTDDKVNNRDPKKALIISPYKWERKFDDGSVMARSVLNSIPEYEGNIDYVVNKDTTDTNVILDDFYSWDNYDYIYLITHGSNVCKELTVLKNQRNKNEEKCHTFIATGLTMDVNSQPASRGLIIYGTKNKELGISDPVVKIGLSEDFFRIAYPDGLDNAILNITACQVAAESGSNLANILNGGKFVMMGWTDSVFNSHQFHANKTLLEMLQKGLPLEYALEKVDEAGYKRVTFTYKNETITTEYKRFAPNGGDQRIREVIKLVDLNGPLEDGDLITAERKNGTDHLNLNALVEGVTEDEKDQYTIRIEMDGEMIGEEYDLSEAKQESEYGYLVELDDIDTGQILSDTRYELEAIVDLPEGGESRFEVILQVASCYFNVTVSGNFSGEFDGPARMRIQDNSVGIDLESRAFVNGIENSKNFVANAGATVDMSGDGEIIPNEYSVTGASAAQYNVYSATYIPGFDEADCDQCGGTFRIDNVTDLEDNEKSMTGEFNVTIPVTEPRPDPENPLLINLTGTFTAVTGSSLDPNSPYTQCKITYAED